MSDERWLRCRVSKGMFSDEAVIVITEKDGREQSFIVPYSDVKNGEKGAGTVKVSLVERGSSRWAVLPTTYADSIAVREEDLIKS